MRGGAMSVQQTVTFKSAGKQLVGVIQRAGAPCGAGVVFAHGWSGYRVGPHGMFVHCARRLAIEGIPSLRFDFRGRGDSEGELEDASLITMAADMSPAVDCLIEHTGANQVFLVGICSGAEVAFAAATCHSAIAGLALWSAPVFWADAAEGEEINTAEVASRKKRYYAAEYLRKLLRPETWSKLFSGRIQFGIVARVLLARRKSTTDIDSATTPQEWRRNVLREFAGFGGKVLGVYGAHDPTTGQALQWYQSLCTDYAIPYSHHLVQGANHSYYSLVWEREVMEKTLSWLKENR